MANKIKLKQSSVSGKVPTTTDLDLGELGINTYDGKLFLKQKVGAVETIIDVTGAASGVTSVSGSAPIVSSGGVTPSISISAATTLAAGSMSAADKTKIDAVTGTNTGDETASTIKTKLGITTLSGSNTGDQTITLTGDITGSGSGSFVTTLATITDSGTGTFKKITANSKGLITGSVAVAQADITGLLGAGSISNTMLANSAVANLSGTNTGDQTLPTTLPASDVYAWAKNATKPTYTATEVSLGNVSNTSDANKPVSTATQTALDLKSPLGSPTFTGTLNSANLAYTGTLTGGTGVLNIGSGQVYKDASGNVGIGTSSPNNKLTVGTPNLNGGSSCVASFSGANVANLNTSGMVVITPTDSIAADIGGSIGFAANGTIVYPTGTIAGRRENATANNYASYMQFSTCSSSGTVVEKMRLDASGNLLVGTTSVTSGGKILVVADSSNVAYFRNTAGTGVYLVSGGNSWTASSDERIKTDLIPIENGLEKVNSLRSVTGRYKTDKVGTSRSFLIAQDVQKVLPEAVSVQDDDLGTLGVAYTEVIPLLVASIKELKAIIDTQNARIEALEAK